MSLRDEGFRFVHRAPDWFDWVHPLEVRAEDVDLTGVSGDELETFVRLAIDGAVSNE